MTFVVSGGTYTQSTDQPFSGTTPTPVCRYKGKTYVQDEVWQDGCDYNCTCDDAFTGYYRCRGLCPTYTQLPPSCHLITVPGQCCPDLDCPIHADPSTKEPPTVIPGIFCKYKGQYYTKGQTWSDGCDATCTCTGNGFYSCGSVCLNWQNIPSQCWMETAPPGLCCKQPTCPDSVNVIFNIPMTYKGGTYTQSTRQPITTSTPVCRYKGKTFVQDEVWQDGCDYNCTCDDAFTGYYRCRGLCPTYTQLPPSCHLITVPGQCCPDLDCPPLVHPSTDKPPTILPGISCKYKGQYYTTGETWSDGCDATCTCTGNGFYSCGSVCLNWQNIPSQCWMETAPPGLCCEQPTCPDSVNVIFNVPMTYKGRYPQSHNIVYV